MTLIDINPTAVMIEKINHQLSDDELSFLRSHESLVMNGVHVSTEYNVLYNNKLKKLKDEIESACNKYFHEVYGASEDVYLKITTSVYAKTNKDESQGMHKHMNSLIAGCFYITKPEGAPIKLICDEPMFKDFNFAFPYKKETKYNQGMISIDANPGDVVIFPGHYYHYVDNGINKEREVIGFSAFVHGDFSKATGTWARYNNSNLDNGYGTRLII